MSGLNCQDRYPTVTIWTCIPFVAVTEGFAELDVDEGELEGDEVYISEELCAKTTAAICARARKVATTGLVIRTMAGC